VTDDDARVFKALADPTRRFLLDRLFVQDGRTLTELESELEMTRFGVMKHLRVLEEAGLVVARRQGREKLHFLNPVPIRLLHDRWIDKYTEPQVTALTALKRDLEAAGPETQRIFIRATPAAISAAVADRRWDQAGASWEVDEVEPGVCRLTLTGAVDGPHPDPAYALSDLKTLLETGSALAVPTG
jgi:DNA-binding transcriptional ArsR family regulator